MDEEIMNMNESDGNEAHEMAFYHCLLACLLGDFGRDF